MSRRILFLRIGPPEHDFRFALAEALHRLGHEVSYLYLGRRSLLLNPARPGQPHVFSRLQALRWLAGRRGQQDLVLDSTDLAFPLLIPLLRRVIGGFWVFDLHDDLRYGTHSLKGLRRCAAMADLTLCAAPNLRELIPQAQHLGNASDLKPQPARSFDGRILVMASIDGRFDFAFLAAAAEAAPGCHFDIHGHVTEAVGGELAALVRGHPNIRHQGAYRSGNIETLVAGYALALAPYRIACPETRFIDPLRFYHALNGGLELITTAIPAASAIAAHAHIVTEPDEIGRIAAALTRVATARCNPGPKAPLPNWTDRAKTLLELVAQAEAGRGNR